VSIFEARDVSVPARLLSSVPVRYPAQASAAEIEAEVPLEIVLDAQGVVVQARALSAVGYGLSDAAVEAVRHYRFSPALRDGHAVRVRMRWTVSFQLR
jgi:TonB family protein